jgi:hypothetical protein
MEPPSINKGVLMMIASQQMPTREFVSSLVSRYPKVRNSDEQVIATSLTVTTDVETVVKSRMSQAIIGP